MTRIAGQEDAGADDWPAFIASIAARWSASSQDRKQDRSKKREQEILRSALRVFARDGISRARIGDIAAEAGMPVSSIYEYFASKEELAYAVPTAHLALFYGEVAETADRPSTCRERLRVYLRLAADFARRNPEWARTLYLEIWPSVLVTQSDVRHSIDDYVRIIVWLLREGERRGEWRSGHDHYETAAILNGALNQTIITWLLFRRPKDLMKAVDSILDRTFALLDLPAAKGASRPTRAKRPSRFGL